MKDKPFTNADYVLRKFPGKGGWTYTEIPEIKQDKRNPFGWVKVKGTIDGFEIHQYKLMPMGKGKLFLPVKAEIRKKIGKQAGDSVRVILYLDDSLLKLPQEIMECFDVESPHVYQQFQSFTESERKAYIDWIYYAKKEETKANRIVKMIARLEKGLTLYDRED